VLALRDRTAPTVLAALDVRLRKLGGSPTYVLTDNEKTVTTEHTAGMAVRNSQVVSFARFYGVTVHTCEPADPASKGGSESTVKIAKAGLVPTDTKLLEPYDTFAEFEQACEVFCDDVNGRIHRVTRRTPNAMLAEEQSRKRYVAREVCAALPREALG
jgi:transposase